MYIGDSINVSYRLLVVDHDLVSFTDIDLHKWPVVLVTNPKHSQFFVPKHEPLHRIKKSTHIRFVNIMFRIIAVCI